MMMPASCTLLHLAFSLSMPPITAQPEDSPRPACSNHANIRTLSCPSLYSPEAVFSSPARGVRRFAPLLNGRATNTDDNFSVHGRACLHLASHVLRVLFMISVWAIVNISHIDSLSR